MTVGNSSAFFLLGLLMSACPLCLPEYFPATSPYEDNTSALWLEFMGALQVAAGSLGVFAASVAAFRKKKRRLRAILAARRARPPVESLPARTVHAFEWAAVLPRFSRHVDGEFLPEFSPVACLDLRHHRERRPQLQ